MVEGMAQEVTPEFEDGPGDGDRVVPPIADIAREMEVKESTLGKW